MRSLLGRFHRPFARSADEQLLLLNNLGDGSTLSLDFTTGVLDPRLTFTRSTSGTYIGADGLVKTATANTPRFDYDPTTLAPRGLLIEGSASTLNQWSEDYTQSYWQKINATISGTSVTCPDGVGRSTVRVVDNATNASHSIRRGITTAAGTTYTLSWFVKKGSTDTFAVQMFWSAAYNATLTVSSIDNNTQTVTSASGVNASVARASYPVHGWYRYSMTFTHPAAVTGTITPDFNFCPINNVGSYVGSGNHTDFFGIQLETGSGASSYIPTGASTGSRAADSCVMTGTNFSSWFAGATEGVFFSEYEAPRSLGSADYFCLGTQYAAGNFIGLSLNNANRYPQASISPGGGFRISGPITTTATTPMKHAAKWSGVNNILVIANGVVGSTHAATTGTPSLTMFSIGSSSSSGTAATGDYLNACVRRVKFWPTALSNAQIIALTT